MKFDIARAWKDENYRQTLSEEQLATLGTNPAGELDDSTLVSVCGGDGPDNFGVGASSSAAAFNGHGHSYALLCDVSVFSLNAIQIPIIPIASPFSQCCSEND